MLLFSLKAHITSAKAETYLSSKRKKKYICKRDQTDSNTFTIHRARNATNNIHYLADYSSI